jgi:hypothetical protein
MKITSQGYTSKLKTPDFSVATEKLGVFNLFAFL